MSENRITGFSIGNKEIYVEEAPVFRASRGRGPRLGLSTTYLHFGNVSVFTTRSLFVTFTNNGNQTLQIRNLASSNYAFSLSASQFNILPGESRTLRVSFTPYLEQTYYGTLTFSTNDSRYANGSVYMMGRGMRF